MCSTFSDDDSPLPNNNKNKKINLSASARERRNEELRRLSRSDDVVIGKTSARADAKDYALDPDRTEAEYLGQATELEREVNLQTDRGLRCLKLLDLDEADEAFERVYELKPDAYAWQAGVVKYYRDELLDAARCFASNAATYETKFAAMGIPASEERIWRDACQLRALSSSRVRTKGVRKGRGSDGLYAQMYDDIVATTAPRLDAMDDEDGDNGETSSRETRKVIRIVRDLFRGSIENDPSAVALNRAKLRSITGEYGSAPTADRKKWKLSSWFYLGLHYDAVGEVDEARSCMKMALRQGQSSGNGEDIIHVLPFLHMSVRDWFDDEEFSLDDDAEDDDDDGGDWSSLTRTGTASIWEKEEPTTYSWSAIDDASLSSEGGSENAETNKQQPKDDGARSVVKIAIESSLEKVRLWIFRNHCVSED